MELIQKQCKRNVQRIQTRRRDTVENIYEVIGDLD